MSCLRSRVRPPGTPHLPPSPCHQSVRSPVIRVSVALSRTLQFVLVGLLFVPVSCPTDRSGYMSYVPETCVTPPR
jgi:hypothetical protein